MAMGTRKDQEQQEELWVPQASLAKGASHPFYQRLNQLLNQISYQLSLTGKEYFMGIAIKSLINVRLWTILLIVPMLAGCGYTSMVLKPTQPCSTHGTKSVAIFTLTVKNAVNPEYGSAPYILKVESNKSATTTFMLDGDWEDKGSPWNMLYADSTDFPVSLGLDAGKYTIRVLHGRGENLLLGWTFDFPLNMEFEVPPGSVVYLGHVVLTTREAKRRMSEW